MQNARLDELQAWINIVGRKTNNLRYADDLSWVALHHVAHSFIKLDKAVIHVISLVRFMW